MKRILNLFVLLSASVLLGTAVFSCSARKVEFAPDTTTVLRNPLNGWVMYLGRNWEPDFWTTQGYDAMPTSEGTVVKVSDYANTAYVRTSWASFEPEEGKYAWDDPDSRLSRVFRSVLDRGMKLSFRIVVDGRDQGQNTPDYVFDAGAEYFTARVGNREVRSPYPDDPVFQGKYTRFIEALAKEYNDIDKVGEPSEQGWGAPSEVSARLLEQAIANGYSLRHDAFGMTGYYQEWEKDFARRWNYRRPIILEGGWITAAHHSYWNDPSGAYREGHSEDVRRGEFEAAEEAHVNMMDLRINDQTRSWFSHCFDLVKRFVAEGGYRLYPEWVKAPAHDEDAVRSHRTGKGSGGIAGEPVFYRKRTAVRTDVMPACLRLNI